MDTTKRTLFGSALLVYFVIAFEVLIMISPFAGFFYAVFNPVLLHLAASPATRWLSAFYLPHMVLPGDPVLQFIRILGSVLFVAGMVCFLVCAAQIYASKLTKKRAVLRGLYAHIRHPQYLALSVAGFGLAILWPRILTVLLWVVMLFVYYFLAKDEERRMLRSHGNEYEPHMQRTGMFLPKRIEDPVRSSRFAKVVVGIGFPVLMVASAFLLRSYTVNHLTTWSQGGPVAVLAILPEDGIKMEHRMGDILRAPEVQKRLAGDKHYLAYFLPKDYIMQGMIADTGADWKLFERHRSLGMIADWVFNPFGHLRNGHHAMHGGQGHVHESKAESGQMPLRRLVFISIEGVRGNSIADLLSMNGLRVPQFMVDVDVHNAKILDIKDLPHGSGWGSVPTPTF